MHQEWGGQWRKSCVRVGAVLVNEEDILDIPVQLDVDGWKEHF